MNKCRRSNCGKTFTQSNNRSRHQKSCTKGDIVIEKPLLVCSNTWCGKLFQRSYNLKRHIEQCTDKINVNVHSCSIPYST